MTGQSVLRKRVGSGLLGAICCWVRSWSGDTAASMPWNIEDSLQNAKPPGISLTGCSSRKGRSFESEEQPWDRPRERPGGNHEMANNFRQVAGNSLWDVYLQFPPVTRTLVTSFFATALITSVGFVDGHLFILSWPAVFSRHFQVRPFQSFSSTLLFHSVLSTVPLSGLSGTLPCSSAGLFRPFKQPRCKGCMAERKDVGYNPFHAESYPVGFKHCEGLVLEVWGICSTCSLGFEAFAERAIESQRVAWCDKEGGDGVKNTI